MTAEEAVAGAPISWGISLELTSARHKAGCSGMRTNPDIRTVLKALVTTDDL